MSDAANQAYERIKEGIVNGIFPPGSHLKEVELVDLCNVSRTPVRDALRRLNAEYFVEFKPNRGTFVREWSDNEIVEIYTYRLLLESYGAAQAARHITELDVRILKSILEKIRECADDQHTDINAFSDESAKLHLTVLAASESKTLNQLVGYLVLPPVLERSINMMTRQDMKRMYFRYQELIDALTARNSDWAETAMRQIILAMKHRFEKSLNRGL